MLCPEAPVETIGEFIDILPEAVRACNAMASAKQEALAEGTAVLQVVEPKNGS